MGIEIQRTEVKGVEILRPAVYTDSRGSFMELWNKKSALPFNFVQDNVSVSKRGVLRGLHFQHPNAQGKLVSVLAGEIFDVAVDIRKGSPTYGKWVSTKLSDENHRQVYMPEGFAHGFQVLSETATVLYKTTNYYDPGSEGTILWNDPELAIPWPIRDAILSEKDALGVVLSEFPAARLPEYA